MVSPADPMGPLLRGDRTRRCLEGNTILLSSFPRSAGEWEFDRSAVISEPTRSVENLRSPAERGNEKREKWQHNSPRVSLRVLARLAARLPLLVLLELERRGRELADDLDLRAVGNLLLHPDRPVAGVHD